MIKKVSIIIPMYNEQKTIATVLNKVKSINLDNIEKEIIVIDDGSKDKSIDAAKKIKGIVILKNNVNSGKATAIKKGIEKAKGEIIVFQDADLELNPKDIKELIKPIVNGEYSVVFGTRFPIGKTHSKISFFFYSGGRFITFMTNLLYNSHLTDIPCGYKAFKSDLIKSLKLKSKKFELEAEVAAKILKKNSKIKEVSVHYSPRSKGEGKKLRYRDGLSALWTLIRNRLS